MRITSEKIYGTNYTLEGRNGYSAIDGSSENGSGCNVLLCGITPKKLANSVCNAVNQVQSESIHSTIAGILIGNSANSNNLYLYSVNDAEIYADYRKELDKNITAKIAKLGKDLSAWDAYDVSSLIHSVTTVFELGAKKYRETFSLQDGWYNLTKLDINICAYRYIQLALLDN